MIISSIRMSPSRLLVLAVVRTEIRFTSRNSNPWLEEKEFQFSFNLSSGILKVFNSVEKPI